MISNRPIFSYTSITKMDFEWMEDILLIENSHKVYRERRNPMALFDENEFKQRFHLSWHTVEDVIDLLSPLLQHDTSKNFALSPDLQFLIALRFLTCATFKGVSSDLFNFHRTTISRSIHRVVNAINTLRHDHIKFPNDLTEVKRQFYVYGNMPGF
jgi:hypothetical protein